MKLIQIAENNWIVLDESEYVLGSVQIQATETPVAYFQPTADLWKGKLTPLVLRELASVLETIQNSL